MDHDLIISYQLTDLTLPKSNKSLLYLAAINVTNDDTNSVLMCKWNGPYNES